MVNSALFFLHFRKCSKHEYKKKTRRNIEMMSKNAMGITNEVYQSSPEDTPIWAQWRKTWKSIGEALLLLLLFAFVSCFCLESKRTSKCYVYFDFSCFHESHITVLKTLSQVYLLTACLKAWKQHGYVTGNGVKSIDVCCYFSFIVSSSFAF